MRSLNVTFLVLASLLFSCGPSSVDELPSLNEDNSTQGLESVHSIEDLDSVSFAITDLAGKWFYSQLRTKPLKIGISPNRGGREIVMEVTQDHKLVMSEKGMDDLAFLIENHPSPLTLNENQLCSEDEVFSKRFHKSCPRVMYISKKELLLAAKVPGMQEEMYYYFMKT